MSQPHQPKEKNLFFTCAVLLQHTPPWIVETDPPGAHRLTEAIEKMDRFCHKIYRVPITWLCNYAVVEKHGETLARFIRDYGDEVAILEHGILTRGYLRGQEAEYQGWVEASGLARPYDYLSKEPELASTQGFHDMPYEHQVTALTYLKKFFDERLGQNTRIFANPCIGAETIRVMAEVGLDGSWAHNWNYFCEGINNKGSLFQPFYVHPENHNVPAAEVRPESVFAVHWGPISQVIMTKVDTHSRLGLPGYCLNALEMTNRSQGLDKFDFHRNVITEYAEWAQWNPYIHIPLQLEAVWMDETTMPEETYDQFPRFNTANTEVFYTQIETALRLGAKPSSISAFADWHRQNIGDTAEMIWHATDHLADVRGKGKDQAYLPTVLFGDKKRQYWFDQSRGFNYVRRYLYDPPVSEKDIKDEYPFATEPNIYLQIKRSHNMRAGIVLSPEKASYELTEFDLTAYEADPAYAAIVWQANIPSYIADADIETGGRLTEFRTVREKNLAILFADLEEGYNKMTFRSDLPNQYIRIVSADVIGKRFEVWIQNDAEPSALHTLNLKLPPGLKIGGFWWDGRYSRSIFHNGWGGYDRITGDFAMWSFYPVTLPIGSGLTRCSIELL